VKNDHGTEKEARPLNGLEDQLEKNNFVRKAIHKTEPE
jgi:hypothetical protein